MLEQFFEKMKLISLNAFRSDKRKLLHQIVRHQTVEISHSWPQINNCKQKSVVIIIKSRYFKLESQPN